MQLNSISIRVLIVTLLIQELRQCFRYDSLHVTGTILPTASFLFRITLQYNVGLPVIRSEYVIRTRIWFFKKEMLI